MKRGEKGVIALIGLVVLAGIIKSSLHVEEKHEREIPYYSTASNDVATKAMEVYHDSGCKSCHSLWTVRDMFQFVPAPILDGIGSIRSEAWLYDYLSSRNPQSILPSRLKKEYQMPSYADLPDGQRHLLAQYLASLKVKDWYLQQTKSAEREKLTGTEQK